MDKTVINPSELGKQLAVPQIKVVEDGKEVIRPDVIQAITQLAQLGQLTKIRKSLEKEEFEGVEDQRWLNATDQLQWIGLIDRYPNTPWISAFFTNYGPDLVRIAINETYDEFELLINETVTIDRSHADERIRRIYYVCNLGDTALVKVIGEY